MNSKINLTQILKKFMPVIPENEKPEEKFVKLLEYAQTTHVDKDVFWKKVNPLLQHCDDETLMEQLGMQDMSRIIHVLQKKHGVSVKCIRFWEDDLEIRIEDTIIGRASYQSVIVHFIKIEGNVLIIEGESSIPACFQEEEASVWVCIEKAESKEEYKTEVVDRVVDKQILGETYEYCRTFHFKYKLSGEKTQIRFFSKIINTNVNYRAIVCMRFSPIATQVNNQYAQVENYILQIKDNSIQCVQSNKKRLNDFENKYKKSLVKTGERDAYRAARFREYYFYFRDIKTYQIWLFADRIDKADDNGEAFFRYVIKHKPDYVKAYFIIDGSSTDYQRLSEMGHVVKAMSRKHQMLHVLADYIFLSQANGFIENPFGKSEIYYRDLQHNSKVIFLQHGITKDNQTEHFNRYYQDFFAFVTSSAKETTSLLELPYFYKKEQIWQTGMPRLDLLYHNEKNQILIMPTWRRNLMYQEWDDKKAVFVWKPTMSFYNSTYCRAYKKLLRSKRLQRICKKAGYEIVFAPHPLIYLYSEAFDVPDYIAQVSYDEICIRSLLAESKLLITDYSSVAFDFAYLKKPVLYYQFDRETFYKGHTYIKGYFDYEENGFGEVVDNESGLIDLVEEYISNECRISPFYEIRENTFFSGIENCCEKLLDMVLR